MYCFNCGSRMVVDSRFCQACGFASSTFQHPPIPPIYSQQPMPVAENSGNALTWVFYRPNWAASLWMPMIWFIPLMTLPAGKVIAAGWIIEAVRRKTSKVPLPTPKDFPVVLTAGVSALIAYWVFLNPPLWIIERIFHWDFDSFLRKTFEFIFERLLARSFAGESSEATVEKAAQFAKWNLLHYLLANTLPAIYRFAATILLAIGLTRFIITEQLRAIFEVWSNLKFAYRYFIGLLKLVPILFVIYLLAAYDAIFDEDWNSFMPLAILGGVVSSVAVYYLSKFAYKCKN